MKKLYPFQAEAHRSVEEKWASGMHRLLLVGPPGAGKTVMGARHCLNRRALWVAHTDELVDQALATLRDLGVRATSARHEDSEARVYVVSIQSLCRGERWNDYTDVDLVVLDEAHHYVADVWGAFPFLNGLWLGLTAVPERSDGRPLGDIFEDIVVAANYSTLREGGYIVPLRVFRPVKPLGSNLADGPLEAWVRLTPERRALVYAQRKTLAEEGAKHARAHGYRAEHLDESTPIGTRRELVQKFRAGDIELLYNVFILSEGFDAPEAGAVVLAHRFEFVGGLLQTTGRALRAREGKRFGVVLDLCGSTHRHGMPDEDRIYSLAGRPITPKGEITAGSGEPREAKQELMPTPLELAQWGVFDPNYTLPEGITLGRVLTVERARTGAQRARPAFRKLVGDHLTGLSDAEPKETSG